MLELKNILNHFLLPKYTINKIKIIKIEIDGKEFKNEVNPCEDD